MKNYGWRWNVRSRIAPISVAALLGALAAAPGHAAWAQEPAGLSLEEAIRLAKRGNPTFLSTANDVDDARWQVREAYGQFLPSLTVGAGAQYEEAGVQRFGVFSSEDISAGATDYFLSQYFMSLNYSISGNTFFRAKSARANRRATEARVGAAEFTLESAVTVQYLAALRAREAVEVAERQVARWEANFELVSGRVAAGAALSTDGKQAEVDFGRARVTLLQAENLYRTEVARLIEQLGTEVDPAAELVSDFEVFEPAWDRETLTRMAVTGHPSLRAAAAAEAATGAELNQARSSYFPTVSASAVWSGFSREIGSEGFLLGQQRAGLEGQRRGCEFNNALLQAVPGLPGLEAEDCGRYVLTPELERQILAGNRVFPFDFTKQPLSLQLNVTLPVFQGFTKNRNVAQAQAVNRDARHSRRAEELRLKTAVTQSYDDLVTAYRSLQIQERNLEVATDQLELARQRYTLGAAAFLELLDAEDSMAQAERDHLAAVYDFHAGMWSLEAAVGMRLRPE